MYKLVLVDICLENLIEQLLILILGVKELKKLINYGDNLEELLVIYIVVIMFLILVM